MTEPSHRPIAHQEQAKWTPERIANWANTKGADFGEYVRRLLAQNIYPERNFKAALGIIRLTEKHGVDRAQIACRKSILLGSID